MSYPINDKTKANKIKDNFEKELVKIKTIGYDKIINQLRKKVIPTSLKNKLEDKRNDKDKGFEEMIHNHKEFTHLSNINCQRCNYDKREIEAEILINSLNGNETTKDFAGVSKTLFKLKIIRGRYDDVMAYQWEWK